ncbi:hypothetical protein [Psychrobacter sp. ANT_WB68]|uniref:hypothetical protein n=1 Tax=Psychrobacter sp. ANT_WB68 TaxID=2597355 RepID=UPI0011F2C322|nr:hypothetical protein [Psychrobacter sp. ANT_WB68]KAA0915820.1 hypothetical protein FQ084_04610 [Psychrobacter sp. ANT_WB68]
MSDFIPNPNLNFEQLWDNSSADLNFGSVGDSTIEPNTVNASGDVYHDLTGVVASSIYYDSNVFRGLIGDISSDMQNAKLQGISKQGQFESNDKLTTNINTDWQQSRLIGTDNQVQFEANTKLVSSEQILTESAKLVGTSSNQLAEYQTFIASKNTLKNEDARLVGQSQWYGFEAMLKRQAERQIKGEYSELLARKLSTDSQYAKLSGCSFEQLIEFAKLPPWIGCHGNLIPDETFDRSTNLHFACKWLPSTNLNFGTICYHNNEQPEPLPSTGVIFVTNSVSLVRSDDGREIKLLAFTVGIDSNSYTWSFSATVPLSELSKVDTAHEQRIGVDFTCNGNLWRFVLDSCDDSVSFGESSLTIKGKSRAMLLAHPYATQRGFKFDTAMSARQIADAELNRSGVPSGFTLDWQLAGVNGWNIPANTYSYTGKTPINSLQWIAEAAGGFINADMSADVLHVLAHYPIPSWEWAAQTPSINLPMSLITSRSRGRVNKPGYNGVTLYGENDNGIGALIKRTGTSGGYQPPMVTSDLMTDTAAAISRGKMILSDTGDIGNIGISMPLHTDIGVLKPSTLIGVNDGESWVGMVRGTTITGRLSSNRALEIEQSIDVERHFDKEVTGG